ncbi:unnamed protein product [Phytomonas sp. EM1]|nr:unnamed protein product [Phytomonas sp. EM1]|eukprot:CCW65836.1 unnamed protein product [Phytomonas sp. isolate EM1]
MPLLHSVTPLDLKQLSRQQKVELLHQNRTGMYHNANAVLFLATDLLAGGSTGLSTVELYEVYDQILVALLECGRAAHARRYLNLLKKKFGHKSTRVMLRHGMCLEAEGSLEEAKAVYDAVHKASPTNDFAIKRLSAVYKGQGDYQAAINILEKDKVFTDEEGQSYTFLEVHRGNALLVYKELSNLYYLIGNLDKAIEYIEEASLFEANSYFFHTRLAELYYMKKDLRRVVVEYSQSLILNQKPNNSRSAYGLCLVVNEILKNHQSGVQRLDEEEETQMRELRDMAADTLRCMYAGSPTLSHLEAFFQREF